jgi:hypothetical protein
MNGGGYRKPRNEELRNLYPSPNIIRVTIPKRIRWAGHVAHMAQMSNAQNILAEKPKEKKPLGRPRRRCELGKILRTLFNCLRLKNSYELL